MIHGKNEVVHVLLDRGLLDAGDVVAACANTRERWDAGWHIAQLARHTSGA